MRHDSWKDAHDRLYHEDGSPTEILRKMQEATREPASTDERVRFSIIRLSNEAQRLITSIRTTAHALGATDRKDRDGIQVCYTRLNAAQKALSEYVEQLEYHCRIPREVQVRFD